MLPLDLPLSWVMMLWLPRLLFLLLLPPLLLPASVDTLRLQFLLIAASLLFCFMFTFSFVFCPEEGTVDLYTITDLHIAFFCHILDMIFLCNSILLVLPCPVSLYLLVIIVTNMLTNMLLWSLGCCNCLTGICFILLFILH